MGEVDRTAFIQALEHRPKVTTATTTTTEADSIPVIDFSLLNSPKKEELDRLVSEIGEACSKWGFFQVINHGVPSEYRQRIESASRKFFSLSKEEKLMVKKNEVSPMGYYDTEHTKNVRDWKEVFDFAVDDDQKMKQLINQWPKYPPELRDACEEYAREMKKLCFKLLEVICISLGLAGNRLNGFFEEHTSFMRLNHYPPCPIPHLALGVGRHKDPGALTVLAQDDVAGLEVKRKAADGDWILVKPILDAYIINVGDIIQVWSNDKYESVEHRVTVNSERERFSIPFFFNPAQSAWVEPLEEMITQGNPTKYKAFNVGNFFATRQRSNLKKLDVENIQIYHFKI